MKYLLDTNACIRYLRDPKSRVRTELGMQPPTDLLLSSVVLSELHRGALRSQNPPQERIKVDVFVAPFKILSFDQAAAEEHAEIRVGLERRGLPIGPYDMMIAAIARVHGHTLVTHNIAEFSRIRNLLLVDWEVP